MIVALTLVFPFSHLWLTFCLENDGWRVEKQSVWSTFRHQIVGCYLAIIAEDSPPSTEQ